MDRSPTVPLSAFIAIAVIIGGVFWIKGPLESLRPVPADRGNRESFGLEDVDARLWQDPFAAIHEYREAKSPGGGSTSDASHPLTDLADAVATGHVPARNTLVVPVMVPGGDHADELEMRRRARRSVLAALGVVDYVPEDADHVGYVNTNWTIPAPGAGPSRLIDPEAAAFVGTSPRPTRPPTMSLMIPFEWFSREGLALKDRDRYAKADGHKRILVLWLDESVIGSRILEMLDELLDNLTMDAYSDFGGVHIIGPASSTTVLGLMRKNTSAYTGFVSLTDQDDATISSTIFSLMDTYLDYGLPPELQVESESMKALAQQLDSIEIGEQPADSTLDAAATRIAQHLVESPATGAIDDLDDRWDLTVVGLWKATLMAPIDPVTREDIGATVDLLALASANVARELPDASWTAASIRDLADVVSHHFWQSPYRSYETWLAESYPDLTGDDVAVVAETLALIQRALNPIVADIARLQPDSTVAYADAHLLLSVAEAYHTSLAHEGFTEESPARSTKQRRQMQPAEPPLAEVQAVAERWSNGDSDPTREEFALAHSALGDATRERSELTEEMAWRDHAVHHWRLALRLRDVQDLDERISLHGALGVLLWTPSAMNDATWIEPTTTGIDWTLEDIRKIAAFSPIPVYAQWLRKNIQVASDEDPTWNWLIAGGWQQRRTDWEDEQGLSQSAYRPHREMTFFSCRSTASTDLLIDELQIGRSSVGFEEQFRDIVGAGYVRAVATDEALMESLVDELRLRDVHLGDQDVQIALIGEWDTFYGRALPRTFRTVVARAEAKHAGKHGKHGEHPPTHTRADGRSPRIHEFKYLRGLDGVLPGSPETKIKAGDRNASAPSTASAAFLPRPDDAAWPFGRSQLDNLQRMAAGLERLDEQVKQANKRLSRTGKGIDVIGVVGSDIYDKLLILQALAPRFPDATFFTTDLDAQMLHPTQQSWARNVVVVSSYGLALSDSFQRYTLPFRDSYQTATYVAALQAVDENMKHDLALIPRVFEIGRHGAVDLSPHDATGLHPPFEKSGEWYRSGWPLAGILIVVAAGLVAVLSARRAYRSNQGTGDRDTSETSPVAIRMVVGSVAALVVGFLILHAVSVTLWNRGGYEPLAAFGGVSAWPIQYWRWGALVLSGFFFWFASRTLGAHVKRVETRFGLDEHAATEAADSGRKDLQNTLAHWGTYREWGRTKRRLIRMGCGTAIFVVVTLGFSMIHGLPSAAFRGGEIQWLHWALLLASGISTAAVTIFVLDANFICWRNIVALAPERTGWPNRVFNAFRTRLQIPKGIREPVNQVLDLEIIADTTRVVGNLLQWPFLLLFVMILSRNTLHERWSLTPTLLYSYGVLFSLALVSAVGLRIQAARARNHVLSNVRGWHCGIDADEFVPGADHEIADTGEEPAAEPRAKQEHGPDVVRPPGERAMRKTKRSPQPEPDCAWIDRIYGHVETMDKGAFAPWYRHPIIQSVLLPFSGLVLVTVTEVISRSGP